MTTLQIILTILLSVVWAIVIVRAIIRAYRVKRQKPTYREMSKQLKFHTEKARELDAKLKDIDRNTPHSTKHHTEYNGSFDEFLEHRRKQSEHEILKATDLSKDANKYDDEIIRIGDDRKIIPNIDQDGKISIVIKQSSLTHISDGERFLASNDEFWQSKVKDLTNEEISKIIEEFKNESIGKSYDPSELTIESNTSDTCSDNSSVDFGGGDSGGSGSGNDY